MTGVFATPDTAITLCAEGALCTDRGDHDAAIARYRDAVAAAPRVLALHMILANAQQLAGRALDARETLRRAARVAARPDAETEFALGRALVDAGAGADAVPSFQRVRAERPRDAAAAAALAAALRDAQQIDHAWTAAQDALALAPRDPVALLTAALIRHDLADFDGAMTLCEESLRVRPDSAGARLTRGTLHHLRGDTRAGWRDFEARALPQPDTGAQPWHGEALTGRSILLLGEQGVGDQLQFLRFVRHDAFARAARVVIACQPDAVSLLVAAGYDAVSRSAPMPPTDFFAPLLSLPARLPERVYESGVTAPYLVLSEVSARFARAAGVRRVGVVWAGNPAHRNDAVRSAPASLMRALIDAQPSLTFVCLQHGASVASLGARNCSVPARGDWYETARQLSTLDLLITVDTGIAHLAGAMGVPTWIMLPHVPDWRWGASGECTPWYPSARLFRQPARGDWYAVLAQVSGALSEISGALTPAD
jgi:tetratricopeptide (TPR) repeat protein